MGPLWLNRYSNERCISLSISDFKSYLVKLWERHHKRSAGRTNPFISVQEGRTACSVPEDCCGNVPATEGCSDRCENAVRGTLTLLLPWMARWYGACWEVEMPGRARGKMRGIYDWRYTCQNNPFYSDPPLFNTDFSFTSKTYNPKNSNDYELFISKCYRWRRIYCICEYKCVLWVTTSLFTDIPTLW